MYCITTDDETLGEYFLTRVDVRAPAPSSEDLAEITAFDLC